MKNMKTKIVLEKLDEVRVEFKEKLSKLVNKKKHKIEYKDLVKLVIVEVINLYNLLGVQLNDKVKEVKIGAYTEYEGTSLWMIKACKWDVEIYDLFFTHNYYGSCSGCDALEAVLEGSSGDRKIDLLYKLCLGIANNFKPLVLIDEDYTRFRWDDDMEELN